MSIEIRAVRKAFGAFLALDGIDLSVPEGSLVALLGPSGCGKTTLLRIIAGLELPDSGSILLDARDTTDLRAGPGRDLPGETSRPGARARRPRQSPAPREEGLIRERRGYLRKDT